MPTNGAARRSAGRIEPTQGCLPRSADTPRAVPPRVLCESRRPGARRVRQSAAAPTGARRTARTQRRSALVPCCRFRNADNGPGWDQGLGRRTRSSALGDGLLVDRCASSPPRRPGRGHAEALSPRDSPGVRFRSLGSRRPNRGCFGHTERSSQPQGTTVDCCSSSPQFTRACYQRGRASLISQLSAKPTMWAYPTPKCRSARSWPVRSRQCRRTSSR